MKSFLSTIVFCLLTIFNAYTQPTLNWVKSFGSVGNDQGNSIAVDPSENIFTTGFFDGTVDFDPSAAVFNLSSIGSWDVFVSKLDSLGNLIWTKQFGGIGVDNGVSIDLDNSGNVYVTGSFTGTADFDPNSGVFNLISNGNSDVFVVKLDSSGSLVWAKNFGGTGGDNGNSIIIDSNENVFFTGSFLGTADFDPGINTYNLITSGNTDVFVSKLDFLGNLVWAKSLGGTGHDGGYSIALDKNGNIYTSGFFEVIADFDPNTGSFNLTSNGSSDVFVVKQDSIGNLVWAKNFGGTGADWANSIAVDLNENVFFTGYFIGTADFDPSIGVINLTSAGGKDIFIAKLDLLGDLTWAKRIGGVSNDYANSIAIDSSANVYIMGDQYSPVADYDPNVGVFELYNFDIEANFIAKYDSNANFICAMSVTPGNNETSYNHHVAINNNSEVWVVANFSGANVDFNPCTSFNNPGFKGNNDIYIAKYNFISCNCMLDVLITETPIICNNQCSSIAIANPVGGIPPYTYNWTTGDTTKIITNLCIGIYIVTIADSVGATASDTIIINQPPIITTTQNQSICSFESFTLPGGNIVNTAGVYIDTLASASIYGCDSVVTTILTVNAPQFFTQTFTECQGFSVSVGANSYNTSGAYVDTLTATGSCEIVTTNLTIYPIATSSTSTTICQGDSIILGGNFQTISGNYNDTIFGGSSFGCDSLITTSLIVNPLGSFTQNPSICQGQIFNLPNGILTNTSGTFIDTLVGASINGCDSVIITNLTVTPTKTFSQNLLECQGFSITVGSNTYANTGVFIDTLTSVNGCDSVVTTSLTVNDFPNLTVSNDTSIIACNSVELTATGATSYIWGPTVGLNCSVCPNPIAEPRTTTTYIVTGTLNNCSSFGTVTVIVEENTGEVLSPNIFTPNYDGINDGFNIYQNCFKSIHKIIYNRWGMVVFESNLTHEVWDGRTNAGVEVPNGTYFYIFEATIDGTNNVDNKKTFKGTITLLR